MDREAIELAEKFCIDEYTDHVIYKYLASHERDPKLRSILEKLAKDEEEHYHFWRKIVGRDCSSQVSGLKLTMIRLMRRIFGLTFTLKWLERHEEEVIEEYKRFLDRLDDPQLRRELEEIIRDEESHENNLIGSIEETIVKYLSFIVLGLADAIVEITGVHAGFLGVTNQTVMAGIAGLVVGVSAAISMASAAYLQAKSDPTRDPGKSALMTGVGYIGAVALLAAPYFATHNMIVAFTASLLLGVALIGMFTYYSAIVFDRKFSREFAESVGLMMGTALVAYVFGEVLGAEFGIRT